jgi:transmembrane sensor
MNVQAFPNLALAREQAATWVARLDRGLTREEQSEFRAWYAHPVNARAMRQLSALWTEMDALQACAAAPAEAASGGAATSRRGHRAAIAASLVVAVVIAGFAWTQFDGKPALAPRLAKSAATYATGIGEQRSVPLSDGSTLAINTGSQVEIVSLEGATRELRLLRGEALFMVAHDPSRPFRVNVNGHVVEAVGTAFDVRLHDGGGLEVIVTEGRVKLSAGETTMGLLNRGQAMRIAADGSARISDLDGEALTARLAWRNGMVVFDGQTLPEALAEFSRYTSVRFIVTDARLRQLRVGGYFPAGDTDYLLDALRSNFSLDSTRNPDGSIQIEPSR